MRRLCLLLVAAAALAVSVHGQRRCFSDVDCPQHAACDLRVSGRCRCDPDFTAWLDGCVPRRRLGEQCQVSPQCRARDEHAVCDEQQRTCNCQRGYRSVDGRCQFEFLVTDPTLPPAEDAELERILGISREGRRRMAELHRESFVRGLAVTGVLVGLTLVVFTGAWLVSRRVRQREQQEAAALPEKYGAPPPYSISEGQPGAAESYEDMAAAVAYSQAGPVA